MCPHHTIRHHILIQPRKILSVLTPQFANKDVRDARFQVFTIHILISVVFVMMPEYGDISSPGVSRCHNVPISDDSVLSGDSATVRPSPGHRREQTRDNEHVTQSFVSFNYPFPRRDKMQCGRASFGATSDDLKLISDNIDQYHSGSISKMIKCYDASHVINEQSLEVYSLR